MDLGYDDEPRSLLRGLASRRIADDSEFGDVISLLLNDEQKGPSNLGQGDEDSRPCKHQDPGSSLLFASFTRTGSRSLPWWDPPTSGQACDRSAGKEEDCVSLMSCRHLYPRRSTSFNLDHLLSCEFDVSDLKTDEMETPGSGGDAESTIPSRPRPLEALKLASHITSATTVLFVDIQGFSTQCAKMSVAQVGSWIAEFYARVEEISAKHGVCTVEARGDCCVCVCGDVPAPLVGSQTQETSGQVSRMLNFAAELEATLPSLQCPCSTIARMGLATGMVSFLLSAESRPSFACVHGNTAMLAEQMQALAQPGRLLVHESSLKRWSTETGRPCPPTQFHFCKGIGLQQAAAYDLPRSSFDYKLSAKRKHSY